MKPLDFSFPPELEMPHPCCGGCGTIIDWPGVCEVCYSKEMAKCSRETWRTVRDRIPPRYRESRFGSEILPTRVARLDAIVEAQAAVGGPVLFVGPKQSGKSTLAAAVYHEIADVASRSEPGSARNIRGLGLQWASALSLCSARKQYPLGSGEAPDVAIALSATVLVLDDLGAEADPTACTDVIFARFETNKPMIISTGLDSVQLETKYGKGVAARICNAAIIVTGKVPIGVVGRIP